ncbi:MAG: glycosyltransferase family 2 protein, partial [Pseudomonadota bacterium]
AMISVVVPTFNRPDGLKRAVMSVFQQTLAADGFDLIIVDNAPDGSAADTIAELRTACPETINFIALHEPAAGVANARNRAMRAVKTDLVAFLDDDQSAPKSWLEALLNAHHRTPAAVTFGPVRTVLPTGQRRHQTYFDAFFSREPEFESGYIEATFGCGNALVDFSKVPGHAPWFDVAMNESGGEDDVLFVRIRDAFGRFAWAADAPVWEHPPVSRVALTYTLKRAFSYGQAPITLARRKTERPIFTILFWMLIGLAKTVWHGLFWLMLALLRHPNRAFQLDRAVRGLGKLFWWIDLRFYGAAALRAKPSSSAPPNAPTLSTGTEQA